MLIPHQNKLTELSYGASNGRLWHYVMKMLVQECSSGRQHPSIPAELTQSMRYNNSTTL